MKKAAVADIISIDQKLKASRGAKIALTRQRKLQAVQQVLQCAQCAFKCEKCGAQIQSHEDTPADRDRKHSVPYRFCESCSGEYIEYIEKLTGRDDPENYWHNEAWMKTWQTWIGYQNAIDRYLQSKEFRKLLHELKS
ncbi:MAG: hypothetical protein Q8P24_18790 [Desulfobacterales bacterium]|nr:hypothetical protein [Desulfobacterales bacterium]